MTRLAMARRYWPRRADGLPPHQREVEAFPRFSDQPLRWAPAPKEPSLSVVVDGSSVVEITADGLARVDRIERTHDFHCVTTWTHRDVRWGGWPLRELLMAAGVDIGSLPSFAKVVGGDGRHAVSLTEDLLRPSVLVVDHMHGAPLSQRHGGPIRLVSPEQYGYKSAKHLERIEFSPEQPDGSFGKKEHLRARVALEERHGSLPNWLVRWPYRLSVVPTALAGDRGLERSPSQ